MTDQRIVELWQAYNGNILSFARAVARESSQNGIPIEDAREPEQSPQTPLIDEY